jgi:uncharacterized membrane protein YhaH (DUF805 family)
LSYSTLATKVAYYELNLLTKGDCMQFQESIKTCLTKYVDFKGRASRSEFWWFVLFSAIANFGSGAISDQLQVIVALALFLPYLAASIRRLHDIGKNWYWILIGIIPLIGALVLIYFYVQKSSPTANAFGDVPPGADVAEIT